MVPEHVFMYVFLDDPRFFSEKIGPMLKLAAE